MWMIRSGGWNLEEIYNCKSLSAFRDVKKTNTSSESNYSNRKYGVFNLIPNFVLEKMNNHSSLPNSSSASVNSNGNSKFVTCNVCGELVIGKRFAPHLERCMTGGKRGQRRHYDALSYTSTTRTKPKKEQIDPFPNSPIIRIKLRNGGNIQLRFQFRINKLNLIHDSVPYGNTFRTGVSLEEFEKAKEEEQSRIQST